MTLEKFKRGLSQSAIGLYRTCPYAYKLHYIDRCQPIFWEPAYLEIGSIVHDSIDFYYRHNFLQHANSSEDILYYTYKKLKEDWPESSSTMTPEFFLKAYECLQNHAKWEYQLLQRGQRTCPLTELKIPEKGFFGIIDYVDLNNDVVIDWKSGSSAYLSHDYRMQAAIYKVLYDAKFGRNLTHFQFFFLGANQWRTVRYDTEKQEEVLKETLEFKDKIQQAYEDDIWPKEPRLPTECKNCQYKLFCKIKKL